MKLHNFFKSDIFLSIVIFILAFPQRFILTSKGFFAFNFDQGRDFLEVSQILSGNLSLIGPSMGGISGVFYGPWWYYFLVPIMWIAGGDPQVVANIFAILGTLTIVGLYLLLMSITNSKKISFFISIVAAISANWMVGSTNFWNPFLAPIFLMVFLYSLNKLFLTSKKRYYFLIGLSSFLVMDSSALFGTALVVFLLMSTLIYRKHFLKKEFFLTLLAGLIILLPRIIFELRNDFLMTKAVFNFLQSPTVYGETLNFAERFLSRINQFTSIFTLTFSRGNSGIAIFILTILAAFMVFALKNKKILQRIKSDYYLMYLFLLLLSTLIVFSIYKDRLWDYYLIALPTIFIVVLARLLMHASRLKNSSIILLAYLLLIIVLNFRRDIYPPYSITWEGDDSTYRNPKLVMEYIASENPQDYNYFSYSSAIFDPPIDYLFNWYSENGILSKPNAHSNVMYLIIRESSTNKYLTTGWYGDKTKDKTIVIDKKSFPGDIAVEKHIKL